MSQSLIVRYYFFASEVRDWLEMMKLRAAYDDGSGEGIVLIFTFDAR